MEECQIAFQELRKYLVAAPFLTRMVEGEMLYLYLAISLVMVSSILVREDEGVQRPAYYTNSLPKDTKTCYPRIEITICSSDLVLVASTLLPGLFYHYYDRLVPEVSLLKVGHL